MPTYVYRREDGTTFEIEQRITEDALEKDPETGQKVRRLISGGTGLIFKGSGFYINDYARSGSGDKTPGGAESGSEGGAEKAASSNGAKDSAPKSESKATQAGNSE